MRGDTLLESLRLPDGLRKRERGLAPCLGHQEVLGPIAVYYLIKKDSAWS